MEWGTKFQSIWWIKAKTAGATSNMARKSEFGLAPRDRARTCDLTVNSRPLYQLSYQGKL